VKERDVYEREVGAAHRELAVHRLYEAGYSRSEVLAAVFHDLEEFFTNAEQLRFALEHDVLLWEHGYLDRTKEKTPWFRPVLVRLLEQLRTALRTDRAACLQIAADWLPQISRGIQNSARRFQLARELDDMRQDLVVDACWSDIGDLLEGSLQPLLRFFYAERKLVTSVHVPVDAVNKETFGNLITYLRSDGFDDIYAPSPLGLPLSQWRNVAFHKSYHFDPDTENVVCEYGKAVPRQTFIVPPKRMPEMLLHVHDLTYVHKIAATFFQIDHIREIVPASTSLPVSVDTLLSTFIAAVASAGFQATKFQRKGEYLRVMLDSVPERGVEATVREARLLSLKFAELLGSKGLEMHVRVRGSSSEFVLKAPPKICIAYHRGELSRTRFIANLLLLYKR
jgi:hypothetical protein